MLGVLLGGLIAARWGWKAAFGVVGFPGLVLALLYLAVRDYKTVALTPALNQATRSTGSTVAFVAKSLARSRTMLWVCMGGAAQLVVVSAVWSWLPSFLEPFSQSAARRRRRCARPWWCCSALSAACSGAASSTAPASRRPRFKLFVMAAICIAAMLVLLPTFAATGSAGLSPSSQFALIALGGFLMTCSVGPVSAIVIDVIHPGVRATGASVLALFQNLFGLAAGPFIVGMLSDSLGLASAMTVIPVFGALAAVFFLFASRTYEGDKQRVATVPVRADSAPAVGGVPKAAV